MIAAKRAWKWRNQAARRPLDSFGLEIDLEERERWRWWRRWRRFLPRWVLGWGEFWVGGMLFLRRSPWLSTSLVLITALLLIVFALAWLLDEERLVLRYRRAASRAMAERQWDQAATLLRRLVVLRPRDPELRFLEAVMTGQSDPVAAFKSISQLAKTEDQGHLPAHRWLATAWFETDADTLRSWGADPGLRLEQVSHHVRVVLRFEPLDREARRLSAELLVERDPAGAHAIFESLAREEYRWWLRIASIRRVLGDDLGAEQAIERWIQQARLRLESPDSTDSELALWIGAHIELGRFEQAEAWLLRFEHHFSTDTVARCRSTLIVAALERNYDLAELANLHSILPLLDRALQDDAGNPLIYRLLSRLVTHHPALRPNIEALCREQVAAGLDSGLPHLILGILAYERGDATIAVERLETALRHDPKDVITLNNLAWVLAHGPQADLERAQRLIEVAIQARSDLAVLHETAGALRLRQGDLVGATVCFERALRRDPANPKYLARCAECYEQRGDHSQAQVLRQRASTLRESGCTTSSEPTIKTREEDESKRSRVPEALPAERSLLPHPDAAG